VVGKPAPFVPAEQGKKRKTGGDNQNRKYRNEMVNVNHKRKQKTENGKPRNSKLSFQILIKFPDIAKIFMLFSKLSSVTS
jgi:hypothetical protein